VLLLLSKILDLVRMVLSAPNRDQCGLVLRPDLHNRSGGFETVATLFFGRIETNPSENRVLDKTQKPRTSESNFTARSLKSSR